MNVDDEPPEIEGSVPNPDDAIESFPLEGADRATADDSPLPRQPHMSTAATGPPAWARAPTLLVALIAVIGWGAYLYERARSLPLAHAATRPAAETRESVSDATPAAAPTASPSTMATASMDHDGAAAPLPDAPMVRVGPSGRSRPASERTASARHVAARLPDRDESASRSAISDVDVSGAWVLATETMSGTGVAAQRFHVELKQQGRRVFGIGRGVSETGAEIGQGTQSPIAIRGTFDGRQLTLTFTEAGAKRSSARRFVLVPEDGGLLRGRFSAGGSRGTAEGRRR